jgi:hypothetical protein
MNLKQLRSMIREECKKVGLRGYARLNDLDPGDLCHFLKGRKPPARRLLTSLGLVAVTHYLPKKAAHA